MYVNFSKETTLKETNYVNENVFNKKLWGLFHWMLNLSLKPFGAKNGKTIFGKRTLLGRGDEVRSNVFLKQSLLFVCWSPFLIGFQSTIWNFLLLFMFFCPLVVFFLCFLFASVYENDLELLLLFMSISVQFFYSFFPVCVFYVCVGM